MKHLNSLKSTFGLLAFCCLLLTLTAKYTWSQETSPTPTPTPESEETRIKKAKIEDLKLQKEELELQNAINAAKYPKPTTTPLEGKTEVDANVKIESEMLAYRALSTSANNLVADIKNIKGTDGGKIKSLAILDDSLVKTMLAYSVTSSQMSLMNEEYVSILPQLKTPQNSNGQKFGILTAVAGIAAIQSVVGSFIDLMALLRADTKITGNQFTIGDSAFVSEVFRAVKSSDNTINVFYPAQFSPKAAGTKDYVILRKIQDLYFVKAIAEQLVIEIEETEKAFNEATKTKETFKSRLEQIPNEIKILNEEIKELNTNPASLPAAEIKKKIENIRTQIKNIETERSEILKKQSKNDLALTALEKRLDELYEQIKLPVSTTQSNDRISEIRARIEAATRTPTVVTVVDGSTNEAVTEVQKKVIRKTKQAILIKLKALNTQFNSFYNEITKVDATVGMNPLTSYIKAENLKNSLGCSIDEDTCDNTYLLSLKVISAGGNNRTKKNLFTTVFTGADITHSGGAIVEYRLYDMEGAIKSSNTFRIYEYYRKPKTIAKMSNETFETAEQKNARKEKEKRKRRENPVATDNKSGN